MRPLAGIRVVDLTHVWAGPLATRILADLGADVIKVEPPWSRGPRIAPPGNPWIYPDDEPGEAHWNRQGVFNKLNRNKRSLCVDLKRPEGHAAVLRLIEASDVVIENFSARAMPSMGLGWDVLHRRNPSLVYVAMPGFGSEGPYRDFVAYGPVVECMTGLTSITGYGPEELRMSCMALPDAIAGVSAAAAVVTGLARVAETGEGCRIEACMYDAAVALLGEQYVDRQLYGVGPEVGPNRHPEWVPHGTYRAAGEDAWVVIAVRDEEEWHALCAVAGQGWDSEPRFREREARRAHRAALDEAIEGWTRGVPSEALVLALQGAGVPVGPVNAALDLLADPHLAARGFFVELAAPHLPPVRYPGLPLTFAGAGVDRGDWRPAPTLGQHNRSVLAEVLGLDDAAIDRLEAAGVIATAPRT